jgi:lysophospholipase L1-like esterase
LLAKTKAQIIVINLPYLGSKDIVYPPFNFLLNFRTKQFNDIISSLAHGDRVKLIDLYNGNQKFLQNSKFYSSDQFHPSNEGYMLWSQLIVQMSKALL